MNLTRQTNGGLKTNPPHERRINIEKRVSNKAYASERMSNDRVLHFEIYYSLFDLPARPLIGFEIAPQMLLNATVIIARPSTCMAGGYSAVRF